MPDNSGIKVDIGSLEATVDALQKHQEKLKVALKILADTASKKMESWAKENARWTDRTSNARQGLKGEAYWQDSEKLVTALMHQVDYGIWLELAHERKYAILEEALEQHKDDLIKNYRKLVGG